MTLKILFLTVCFSSSFVISDNNDKCGHEEHFKAWSSHFSRLSTADQNLVMDKLSLVLRSARTEMLNKLLITSQVKRGPQAYESLARFGKTLAEEFDCTDGLSWVEQMTQTGIMFLCGDRNCES